MTETTPDGKGRLKIFLSFATGVGKTFRLLDEAHRRSRRGQDVVIGMIDPRKRQSTIEHMSGFEVIDPQTIHYGGREYGTLNVDAIIKRHPSLVLIDDLEKKNPPGAGHEYRWQDVEQILEHGISVLTSMNVAHLESLNDKIADIVGVRIADTVPDQLLHKAEEIEIIDATPRALINRLERGDIFPQDEIDAQRKTWFKEEVLSALREIAMREAAGRVDEEVIEYRKRKRIEKLWATNDRVLICISPSRPSLRLVRRGWRMAQKMNADAVALYVQEKEPTEEEERILNDDFALSERLGIRVEKKKGKPLDEIIRYCKENNITQLVVGHSEKSKLEQITKGSLINDLVRELRTVDILVVAAETSGG
ncbi:MAG TPA: universal stress protein [Fimbriimonadaceae bacterium]|nr:universal stress protein [Fimbriimonadaceae bacterium]